MRFSQTFDTRRLERPLTWLVWVIIATGVLLRVVVYLQANSMYQDEANVARNIFERSFVGLTHPLNYYQYAPPVFLWIVKLSVTLGGYSEYAYRIYPLLCGIASLFLMYAVIKQYACHLGIWYALLLLAAGPIYVQYSCVTKQYMPDMLIALSLLWLALNNPLEKSSALGLFILWTLTGSLAIWSSMSSVFILGGVGAWYFVVMLKQKSFGKLWFLLAAGALWLLQFGFYYLFILREQANSQYLQNFHHDFFFYPPTDIKTLVFDFNLFFNFLANTGGHQFLSLTFHVTCMIAGIVCLWRNKGEKLVLIGVPLLLLFFAAAVHQYSMIPRLLLFAMPLVLILIAVGLERLLSNRYVLVQASIVVIAIICFANFNALKNFIKPFQREEMKECLAALQKRSINGSQLYVDHLAEPAYIYYTGIHPAKNKWTDLTGAKIIPWGTNFDSLSQTFPAHAAMLYSWDDPSAISIQQETVQRHHDLMDSVIVMGGRVYVYE